VNARGWWIILGFLCLPTVAAAQELTLGIGATGNFYNRTGGADSDHEYTFRISPNALLEDDQGELRWKLRYHPDYERFVNDSESSGFTHRVEGDMTWQINPATSLRVSDSFGFYDSVTRYNEVVSEGEGNEVVEVVDTGFRDDTSIRNTLSATLIRALTPSQSLSFRLGHYLLDYDREARVDRETLSAAANYNHMVSQRNTLGAGVSYRRSSLEGGSDRTSQSTDFYNLFATWNHSFDETLQLSVALGPTWVVGEDRDTRSDLRDRLTFPVLNDAGDRKLVRASSCPTEDGTLILTAECDLIDVNLSSVLFTQEVLSIWNPTRDLHLVGSAPSSSNESLTYFANIRLNKSWERWSGSLAYVRQQSNSSGLGSSAVADILSGFLDWKPSPRWHSSLKASLTRQTSATKGIGTVVVVESTDVNIFGAQFTDVAESVGIRAVEVEQDIEYLTFWTRLDVRYRVTKRTTVFGSVSYWHQERDGIVTNTLGNYDRYRVDFGVRYTFDPIRL